MLKLKRVELQGFKSFCDRSELRFNGDGITAIVGPNGCGKSNISDAISWVLGEQSAKTLRGTRMEDVIFAGTRDRKPVGMAYVTMTLVDPEAHRHHSKPMPVPESPEAAAEQRRPAEVTITRRLYRSGESEYLIDGRLARLRDIQDIFMGTGLGPESYAIIEQGRIGQILSSKPQDRRSVIEEAAGITKFKTRKRLAEAKLEGAKQNLARVYDILEEVGRQVNSLKRQASKARRYAELKAELESRLRVVLSGNYRLVERDAAKTAIDLNLAAGELKTLTEQVAEREKAHEEAQLACYEIEEKLTAARAELSARNVESERTRGRLESQVKEIGSTEQRIAANETESQQLGERVDALDREIAAYQKTVADLEAQIAQARDLLREINLQRETLQAKVREREKAIEAGRQVILRLLGEASTLKNQLAQIDEYLAGIDRESARAGREEETAAAEIERLEGARKQLSETVAQRQLELEHVAGERRRTEAELNDRRESTVQLRREIDGLRNEVSQIRARRESLEQVLAHRTYTTDSVKRLFASLESGKAGDVKPLGLLADYVEVDPQFEKPAEEFLHEELEYVVVKTWQQAESGLDFIRAELDGRATFLVHPEPNGNGKHHLPEPAIGPETGIAARLSDSLRLTNGFKDRATDLLPRLSLCFLAEDRASAQRLSVSYPHLYFLMPDGVCYHGHTVTGGKKSGAGPLAMKREARELASRLNERQAVLDGQVAQLEALQQETAALEAGLERLRVLQVAREKDRVALDHDMRKLGDDLARSNSRLSVARLELERLRRDAEKSVEQRERNHAAVEEKERLRAEREADLEAERLELEKLEAQFTTVGEEHATTRAGLAGLEERHRGERTAMARLEQQFHEITNRRKSIAAEIERLGEQRARLLASNIELDQLAAQLTAGIGALDARVNEMAARDTAMREALKTSEEELKVLRAGVQEYLEKRSQIELDLQRKQMELKYLDETSRKELACPVAELASSDDPIPDADAIAEAEQSANDLRNRIESLGPVNAAAMEEFQEAQQRHDFLTTQRQDLIDSIRDTEKAIQEIDQVSKQKFAEAFEAINHNFRGISQTLFGGGTGEMRLTDQENLNESGIDIICSPPGKRLQNVLLLSGGEKALSAVALLMAIFQFSPSPFCILDEVDAPLDESNIGRLTKLLSEMSASTQFVVITHSKRTMEAAQALYGVTMQEPGVSRLVSVRFHGEASAPAA
ncbi:MAG TPA: chromosome segregation protein SMC [Verrucomicrobiae bacterium]|nr:chromosome segregation protein SMC [Verrucomicrobiae bacterium]